MYKRSINKNQIKFWPTLFLYFGCAGLIAYSASAGFAKPPVVVQPDVAISVYVKTFSIDVSGDLPAGRTINAILVGSPGGKATFCIPNVTDNVAMKETSPGSYTGVYTTKKDQVNNAAVFGQIVLNKARSPLVSAANRISIDTAPPKLSDLIPGDGDMVCMSQPVLHCSFDDGAGTGIDSSKTVVQLDGKDVQPPDINELGFAFKPDALQVGSHAFLVKAFDNAGNFTQSFTHFTVVDPSQCPIKSAKVTNEGVEITPDLNPASSPTKTKLVLSEAFDVALDAPPGAKVAASVAGLKLPIFITEVRPGHYTGKFTPHIGLAIDNSSLVWSYHGTDGKNYLVTGQYPIQIVESPPYQPAILMPNIDEYYQGGVQFAGRALPFTKISCTVYYDTRSDGGVLPFTGTVLTSVVYANKKGEWKVDPISLNVASLFAYDRDTRIWLGVVAEDAAGQKSEPAKVRLDYYP